MVLFTLALLTLVSAPSFPSFVTRPTADDILKRDSTATLNTDVGVCNQGAGTQLSQNAAQLSFSSSQPL